MKKNFNRLILMIQFFTRIPIPIKTKFTNEDFGKGLIFAPVVGLIIGGILFGSYKLLILFFPIPLVVVFNVFIYIAITGGLHLDGLADTFDGIFSGRSKDRILEIMKDSRIGTFGVLALIAIIISDIVLISYINTNAIPYVFLLMPVAGRIGSFISAGISKYAKEDGLGKSFIDFCGNKELIIGIVISFIIFYIFLGLKGVNIVFLTHITALILTYFFTRKINGATGDILGAICELNQFAFLLIVYFLL